MNLSNNAQALSLVDLGKKPGIPDLTFLCWARLMRIDDKEKCYLQGKIFSEHDYNNIVSTSQALSIGNYTVVDVVKGPGHAETLGPHFIYGPNQGSQGKEIVFLRKNLQSARQ